MRHHPRQVWLGLLGLCSALGLLGGTGGAHAQAPTYDHFVYLPLVLRPAPPITDRLLNPGFEGGYTHETFYGPNPAILTPEQWVTWWAVEPENDLQPPEIVRPISSQNPIYLDPIPRIHGGEQAMQLYRWGKYRAGFYQRVAGLPPDATATFSIYAHAWSCNLDPTPERPALSCGDPWGFWFKVGLDPTGGTDPWSPNVIWTEPAYLYDTYALVGPVSAPVGTEGAVTVFTWAEAKWGVKHEDAYLDDASLVVQP